MHMRKAYHTILVSKKDIEENRSSTLRKEKEAFEYLILEKSVRLHYAL
jgi:hypothetical protein